VSFLEAKQSLKELRGIVNRQLSNDEDSVVGSVGGWGVGKDREGWSGEWIGGSLLSGNSVDFVPLCLKKEVVKHRGTEGTERGRKRWRGEIGSGER
jgi:hypothetical protein